MTNLEDQIIARWQQWWEKYWKDNACVSPMTEQTMRAFLDIALDEAQKGMCEPRFTTREVVAVEHALDALNLATKPEFPMTTEARIVILRNLVTPEVLSALGKLQADLDNIKQAQEMLAGYPAKESDHAGLEQKQRQLAYDIADSIRQDICTNMVPIKNESPDSPNYLAWMCDKITQHARDWDIDKLHRWVGYIQGVCVANGYSTLERERDRVRDAKDKD